LATPGCSSPRGELDDHTTASSQSVYTDLTGSSCHSETDKSDPDEIAYFVCPGVGGYTLIVRRVEAGRRSIDVVDADKQVFPLNFPASVTPYMSTLRNRAEWRVKTSRERQTPTALIVSIESHEDSADPGKITRVYVAVAKIASGVACVVEKRPEGQWSALQLRSIADSAQNRVCLTSKAR